MPHLVSGKKSKWCCKTQPWQCLLKSEPSTMKDNHYITALTWDLSFCLVVNHRIYFMFSNLFPAVHLWQVTVVSRAWCQPMCDTKMSITTILLLLVRLMSEIICCLRFCLKSCDVERLKLISHKRSKPINKIAVLKACLTEGIIITWHERLQILRKYIKNHPVLEKKKKIYIILH